VLLIVIKLLYVKEVNRTKKLKILILKIQLDKNLMMWQPLHHICMEYCGMQIVKWSTTAQELFSLDYNSYFMLLFDRCTLRLTGSVDEIWNQVNYSNLTVNITIFYLQLVIHKTETGNDKNIKCKPHKSKSATVMPILMVMTSQ